MSKVTEIPGGLAHLWFAPILDEINAAEAKEKTQTQQP
jgi:hypothetical protein